MKKFSIFLCAVLLFSLCACHANSPEAPAVRKPTFDADGVYTGFSDIPGGYLSTAAAADGCMMVHTGDEEIANYDRWEAFLADSQAGKDAFLRVAVYTKSNNRYHEYYVDLYYCDGKYTVFRRDSGKIYSNGTWQYLRCFESENPQGKDTYVLTDSMELTLENIREYFTAMFSSVMAPSLEQKIPFYQLFFMNYFQE